MTARGFPRRGMAMKATLVLQDMAMAATDMVRAATSIKCRVKMMGETSLAVAVGVAM